MTVENGPTEAAFDATLECPRASFAFERPSQALFDASPASPGAEREGWSQFSDSNRGPTVYKTVALPLS